MAMEFVFRALVAARYTGGATAQDVQAAVQQITQMTGNAWTVAGDDGQTLVLREVGQNGLSADWVVQAGQVVVVDPAVGIVDRLSVDKFLARYRRGDTVAEAVMAKALATPEWVAMLATKLGLSTPPR